MNDLDYLIVEYLLDNNDYLKELINNIKKEKILFPKSLNFIYNNQYEEEVINLIKNEVGYSLSLDPEQSLRISELVRQHSSHLLKET